MTQGKSKNPDKYTLTGQSPLGGTMAPKQGRHLPCTGIASDLLELRQYQRGVGEPSVDGRLPTYREPPDPRTFFWVKFKVYRTQYDRDTSLRTQLMIRENNNLVRPTKTQTLYTYMTKNNMKF